MPIRYFNIIHENDIKYLSSSLTKNHIKKYIHTVSYQDDSIADITPFVNRSSRELSDGKYYVIEYIMPDFRCMFYRIDKEYCYGTEDFDDVMIDGVMIDNDWFMYNDYISIILTKESYDITDKHWNINFGNYICVQDGKLHSCDGPALVMYCGETDYDVENYFLLGKLTTYGGMIEYKSNTMSKQLHEMTVRQIMEYNDNLYKDVTGLIVDYCTNLDLYLIADPDSIKNDEEKVDAIVDQIKDVDKMGRFI